MFLLQSLYTSVALLSIYLLVTSFLSSQRRKSFSKKHGCKSPPALKQKRWMNGFDAAIEQKNWISTNQLFPNITRLFRELNTRTFSLRFVGTTRIWTYDPANVRVLLQTQADDFELSWVRTEAFRPSIGRAVQASNGEVWAHGRALLRPAFNKTNLSDMALFEEHFQNLRNKLPGKGETVNLNPLLHNLSMDVVTHVLMGESANCLKDDANKDLGWAYDTVSRGVIERAFLGALIRFYRNPEFFRAVDVFRSYANRYVKKAMALKVSSPDNSDKKGSYEFISELAKQTDDATFVQDQILGALTAGRNTTASLMSLITYLLARNPAAQKKLREEVARLNGKPPTYAELKNMVYLRWFIDETLRLLPTIPFIDRVAKRDTTLPTGGGPDGKSPIFVAKGQTVAMVFWVMHRDKELWGEDALEFKPERWENTLKSSGKHVAFGGGPRVCPGQNLALTEAAYTTVRLLQTFKTLESRDDQPFKEKFMVSLYSASGTQVAMTE